MNDKAGFVDGSGMHVSSLEQLEEFQRYISQKLYGKRVGAEDCDMVDVVTVRDVDLLSHMQCSPSLANTKQKAGRPA